jgi:glycolate oxidase FAD binding subunit
VTIAAGNAEEIQRLVLAIQDSQLAHSALQIRVAGEATPQADVLFEGTEAGLAAQEASLREMVRAASVVAAGAEVWAARQALWLPPMQDVASESTVAKLSVLPTDLAATLATIERIAKKGDARWSAVVQATGLGSLRLDAAGEALPPMLRELRAAIEASGGSLVVLRQPSGNTQVEAWGSPGDALPLMRALKHQFDSRGMLNPGRYVGGI